LRNKKNLSGLSEIDPGPGLSACGTIEEPGRRLPSAASDIRAWSDAGDAGGRCDGLQTQAAFF